MTGPRIGSLFSGYGGLDMGVMDALGGSVAWHSEIEPAACRILAHHWPDTPNLGDVTAIDWAGIERVDILTGGTPCQDVSEAGPRHGMRAGTRSGLWAAMADAIDALRPSLVVWENVRGALSADADSRMESDPGLLGGFGGTGRPLRALGRVLGDLADLGYDAAWTGLYAADVGAPHRRFRVFLAAWPAADPDSDGRDDGPRRLWEWRAQAQRRGAAADAAGSGRDGRPQSAGRGEVGGAVSAGRGRDAADAARIPGGVTDRDQGFSAADPGRLRGHEGRPAIAGETAGGRASADFGGRGGRNQPSGDGPDGLSLLPTPTVQDGISDNNQEYRRVRGIVGGRGYSSPLVRAASHLGGYAPLGTPRPGMYAQYAPAIARWELVMGRPAPAMIEPSPSSVSGRLSPRFVEWVMGLPDGHVTGRGLARTDELTMLGNGVVRQQAAEALRRLAVMTAHAYGEAA